MRPQDVVSLMSLVLPYGKTGTTYVRPQRTLYPDRFIVPSSCIGWTLQSFRIGNEELLAAPCPIDVFSPLACGVMAPPSLCMGPRDEWRVTATAPSRPKPAHWSLWRKCSSAKRRGLKLLPRAQKRAQRRRLRLFGGAWPRWLPRPLPPPFLMSCVGFTVPTEGERAMMRNWGRS